MIFFFFILINILILITFKKLSLFINVFDIPNKKRKKHIKKVASIGGFIIIINLSIFFLYYYFVNEEIFFLSKKEFILFYISSLLFFVVGFLDDKYDLNPNIKFIIFFIILYFFTSSLPVANIGSLNFSFYNHVLSLEKINPFFTIICFLLFINAFNMFDGVNLQSGFYSIFLLLVLFFKIDLNFFLFVLMIALILFVYLNFKNKCFLGDSGTLLISFIFSFMFIYLYNINKFFYVDEIFLLMLIPGLDLLRLCFSRIVNNKHPFKGDRNHLHHIFLDKVGYNKYLFFTFTLILAPYFIYYFFGGLVYIIIISTLIYLSIIIYSKKNLKF
jgi:UDP-GlcNAc:undecaprenyl-phosphate GlcNAc-1-phosphate transferase